MLTLLGEGEGNTACYAIQVAGWFSEITGQEHVLISSTQNLRCPKRESWRTTDRKARSEACKPSDWEVERSHCSEDAEEQSVLAGVAVLMERRALQRRGILIFVMC